MPHKTTDDLTGFLFTAIGQHWIVDPFVLIYHDDAAIRMNYANGKLTNHGVIYGELFGVYAVGNNPTIINKPGGLIKALEESAIVTGSGGAGMTVVNHGAVIGTSDTGLSIFLLAKDAFVDNRETGLVRGYEIGLSTSAIDAEVANAGKIVGQNDLGVAVAGGNVDLLNAKPGLVKGPVAIRSTETGNLFLDNRGKIDGRIDLDAGGQDDKIVNKGIITSRVDLGGGNDMFVFAGGRQGKVNGEAGSDRFDFRNKLVKKEHAPTIGDFDVAADTIGVSKALFKDIGPKGASLKKKYFEVGKKADDSNDRFIYNDDNGKLFFDKDGVGGAGHKLIAKLDDGLNLKAGDFLVLS